MTEAHVTWFAGRLERDLAHCVQTAFRDGACFVPRALTPDGVEHLLRWSGRLRLAEAERSVGPVRQRARMAVLTGDEFNECLTDEFAHEFAHLVRSRTPSPMRCAGFTPNEATLMAYDGSASGISAHLDGRRYRLLVAIFSLVGDAQLELLEDRASAHAQAAWCCRPGDLVLLRAPGLGGVADGRPMHRVRGTTSRVRVSLTLRMDGTRLAEEVDSTGLSTEPRRVGELQQ